MRVAAGGLTLAAVRHRPRQAVLVLMLAAVVGAAASLGPLWTRAVEQSLLRSALTGASPADRDVVVVSPGTAGPSPAALGRAMAAAAPRQLGRPVTGAVVPVSVSAGPDQPQGTAVVATRGDLCRSVRVVDGSCPAAVGEVLLSASTATFLGTSVGDPVTLTDTADPPTDVQVHVVGTYRPVDSARHWYERVAAARAAPVTPPAADADQAVPESLDLVYATYATVAGTATSSRRVFADLPPRVAAARVDDAATLSSAAERLASSAAQDGATVSSRLPDVVAAADDQRAQARQVVPLLAAQLALLAVVVLGFVCAAATESRRPEVALARLRGLRTGGALTMLLGELGVLVVAGVLLGAVVGAAAAGVAAGGWLAPGVTLELRAQVVGTVLLAALVGVAAVALAAAPTLRQPLVALLRRVPPRASALRLGAVEGGLVAATAAGLVTLQSGEDADGPVALLVPGLLAVAGGLVLGQLVVPVAAGLSRGALRRGRTTPALAGIQVARRPALRRLIAIITVACALLVFAVDAWSVSDRNRDARAELAAGAPVVLTVEAPDATVFRDAVLAVDPRGRFATPVVQARSVSDDGPRTTAVEPLAFGRIARWGSAANTPSTKELRGIVPDLAPPVRITADQLVARVDAKVRGRAVGREPPAVLDKDIDLVLRLRNADGHLLVADLGALRNGVHTYRAVVECRDGCLLRQVEAHRQADDRVRADIAVHVLRLAGSTGGATAVPYDLGPVGEFAAWQAVTIRIGDFSYVQVHPRTPLAFSAVSDGESLTVQRGDVPASPPALAAGKVGMSTNLLPGVVDTAISPGLTGTQAGYEIDGTVRQVPRAGGRGVIVSLAGLTGAPGVVAPSTAYTVWLAADDAARERRLTAALARRGVTVTGRDTIGAHRLTLSRQGPALGLRLGLLGGGVALVLAATVLVVGIATSGPSRARDLAGLRVVGVGASVVRRAAVLEHVGVATLGVLAGAALGLVAAQTALGQVPLLAGQGPELVPVRDAAWPAVAVVTAAALALLLVVSVLVGRSLAAAAVPARLRDGS